MQLKCPNGHGELPVTSETWEWAPDPHANTLYTVVRVCHVCAVSTYEDHRVFLRGVKQGSALPQPEVVVGIDASSIASIVGPKPEPEAPVASTEGDDLGG